jgi:anti-sigma factor RsiW
VLSRLPPGDVEQLSAYADGALSPRDRSAFESRLQVEADLRAALDELRSVKSALASLPSRTVPRSFALRESDVRRTSPRPGFGALRFATVLATGLFVLTTAVRSFPVAARLGAAAPSALTAAEVQGEVGAAIAATAEPGLEFRAEAPAAAAQEEGMADTLATAPTPSPAATGCPDCFQSLMTGKNEPSDAFAGEAEPAVAAARPAFPLAAVQWILALAAIVFGALTVRARRP